MQKKNVEDWEKVGYLTQLSRDRETMKNLKADLLMEGSFDETVIVKEMSLILFLANGFLKVEPKKQHKTESQLVQGV